MADYWVDSALGTGNNDGTSPANAIRGTAAIRTAMQFDHNAGVDAWFRRTSAYDEGVVNLNSDILIEADGTSNSPVRFMSWPRAAIPNTIITQADWTNGSATVDNVVGVTLARTAHQARWCTAPNGKKYFITQIVDSNTFKIDREYSGSTVTGTNGLFQIDADWNYSIRPQAGIDAGWDSDADNLPTIDFNNETYQLKLYSDYYLIFSGFYFIDSADTEGIIYINTVANCMFRNIMTKQNTSNTPIFNIYNGNYTIREFTIEGSGSGSSQRGINIVGSGNPIIMNGATYNCGGAGIIIIGCLYLSNVNIGVEIANGSYDIFQSYGALIRGIDVKLGGTNGYIYSMADYSSIKSCFENYQKILGDNKTFHPLLGTGESIAVTSTDANKKLSDIVLKITPNINTPFITDEWKEILFDAEFELASGSQIIKFWLYNNLGQTLNDTTAKDNVYLEAEYVDSYDDTTEYTTTKSYSEQIDIADATNADDWDYLQVTVAPVTASKVRVKLICSIYDAADYFLIDPEPIIS